MQLMAANVRRGFDASTPPGSPPAGTDVVMFYIGGDTPHVWSAAEIASEHVRYRMPIWVRSNPAGSTQGSQEGRAAVLKARSEGCPVAVTIALDYETAVDQAYLSAFDAEVKAQGNRTMLYGSTGNLFHHARPSGGFWAADPTGSPHQYPGADATQYAFDGAYDLSVIADTVPLWDTQGTKPPPGGGTPPPPRKGLDMPTGQIKAGEHVNIPLPAGVYRTLAVFHDTVEQGVTPPDLRIAIASHSKGFDQGFPTFVIPDNTVHQITFTATDVDRVSLSRNDTGTAAVGWAVW